MKNLLTLLLIIFSTIGHAQTYSITGHLIDANEAPVSYANVVLYDTTDQIVKVETSNDDGFFKIQGLTPGDYYINVSFIGFEDQKIDLMGFSTDKDLGVISMAANSVELETAVVSAKRALVEQKADRTVFNVEGTINSAGDNAIGLLRKAPGVLVDNNNNVTVLGRSGVIIYVDGKRIPLSGDELTSYLETIPSERIDRMDIITNPGAKYEAEGNAGIIDIRLKKNQNIGSNGTVSTALSQGQKGRYNVNLAANKKTEKVNVYGSMGYSDFTGFNDIDFKSDLGPLYFEESNDISNGNKGIDGRLGLDYSLSKHSTIGALYSGGFYDVDAQIDNRIELATQIDKFNIDSILVASNSTTGIQNRNTYNLNYAYGTKAKSFNVDLDYGTYRNTKNTDQPNTYYSDSTESVTLYTNNTYYEAPTDIDIYTFKVDFEQDAAKGRLGLGGKVSRVDTKNAFEFYDANGTTNQLDNSRSNKFNYLENVYAVYASYNRPINQKLSFSSGLRVEQTDATGDLIAYDTTKAEAPVDLNYINYFPSLGLNYTWKPTHNFNLSYSRRINRPDYNVLNPFREQLSEISYSKGNAFLNPEIVNNYELGYTYAYRYNFKMGYSRTTDQITRLIGPENVDPRATFISWDNLATKDVYSFNAALPFQVSTKWNAFFNLSAAYIDNQADYGDGAIVDLQAFTYSFYSQQTYTLPGDMSAEVSGYFSGPGIWGGVFEYNESWSLNLGLQKKFLAKRLNVKLAANDIFFQSGWDGVSSFDGLVSRGMGNHDSRRVSLSMSYKFGNNKIKARKRKTGAEEENKRVSK